MTAGLGGSVMSCTEEGKVHTRVLRLSQSEDRTPAMTVRTPPAVVITADDSDGAPTPDIPKMANGGTLPTILRHDENENCSSPENLSAAPSEQQLHPGDAMLEPSPHVPVTVTHRRSCISEHRRRLGCGLLLGCLVALAWAGGTHLLRALHLDYAQALAANARLSNYSGGGEWSPFPLYDAPFFTAWLCTALNLLFFPVYLVSRLCAPASEKTSLKKEVTESVGPLGERGAPHLLFRCGLFCILWTVSSYMFVHSLSLLDATDVVALYTTNVAFVYLLSWVLLQEQFVGIRIVAVIMCNTGIALFAYMDNTSRNATLGGVVLAAAAAAGTAIYKVLFKKVVGAVTLGQLSFFLTLMGVASIVLSWPFFLALYFAGFETLSWQDMPWLPLLGAALFILLANMLGNFGVMWTYEVFLTLGFMFAIPTSAVVDVYLYSVVFEGMKLAGVVLTMLGFCLVLLPDNWPDYITRVLRWRRNAKYPQPTPPPSASQQDCRTSYTSRLRTHSGRVK